MWVEKAIDIGSGTMKTEISPKRERSSSNKNSAAYKANCLTPRSCPGKTKTSSKYGEKTSHISILLVCARVYSNVSNLRQHMRLIHNPQAVVCPICQKHFNSDLYLKRHYASIHSLNSSETEGGEKEEGATGTNVSNSANWTYQNTDGSIIQQ